jgi:hypothetical protein
MDDLASLDWSAPVKQQLNNPPALPPFRQNSTPQLSGRSTPLSAQQSGSNAPSSAHRPFKAPSKPATPANDSFAGLVPLNSSKSVSNNLSLQERQKQLQQDKLRQEADRKKQYDAHFGATESRFWDNLGSGKSTPEPVASSLQPPLASGPGRQTLSQTINKPFAGLDTASKRPVSSPPAEDDLLAAFNAKAPVNASSHFPPPSTNSGHTIPVHDAHSSHVQASTQKMVSTNSLEDDDDVFGLSQFVQKHAARSAPIVSSDSHDNGDDDILGLLGKPVSEFERKPEPTPVVWESKPEIDNEQALDTSGPHEKAVAELVNMGFPRNKSAIALATTESGLDVQAAVSWLLNQAHADAKQKTQDRSQERARRNSTELDERPRRGDSRSSARESSTSRSRPAWMRAEDGRNRVGQRQSESQNQEKDVSQYATELGSTFLKSANSLWKTGQKKMQKAVAELQQDGDPNVPKWMRNTQGADDQLRTQPGSARTKAHAKDVTDEAMMLEGGGRPTKSSRPPQSHDPELLPSRPILNQDGFHAGPHQAAPSRMLSQSPSRRQETPTVDKRPATKLTRQDVEEQTSKAYVSPARRKKTTPQSGPLVSDRPTPTPLPSTSTSRQSTPVRSNNPFLQATPMPESRSPAVTPPPPRPKAPPRQVPPASSSALSSSASYRQKGSEAFKRGDYTAAHTAYTSALGPLPRTHPVAIIILCNRAVTNIKVGDPRAALLDADAALAIIGVSKGEGEKIVVGTESDKDMREFYGKALMRKAEALEHMEKWTAAGKIWREAVEAGVGGSISIQGRNRCEKAAGGGTPSSALSTARRHPVRKTPPVNPSTLSDLGGVSATDSDAVKKLKAANAAAEKADDEKFALSDQVDAKLVAWKGTKADNLRALLGSLDKVLWPDAGWKKVGMGDLVMPNKVKIIYMKAIAKVHPDKVSFRALQESLNTC